MCSAGRNPPRVRQPSAGKGHGWGNFGDPPSSDSSGVRCQAFHSQDREADVRGDTLGGRGHAPALRIDSPRRKPRQHAVASDTWKLSPGGLFYRTESHASLGTLPDDGRVCRGMEPKALQRFLTSHRRRLLALTRRHGGVGVGIRPGRRPEGSPRKDQVSARWRSAASTLPIAVPGLRLARDRAWTAGSTCRQSWRPGTSPTVPPDITFKTRPEQSPRSRGDPAKVLSPGSPNRFGQNPGLGPPETKDISY